MLILQYFTAFFKYVPLEKKNRIFRIIFMSFFALTCYSLFWFTVFLFSINLCTVWYFYPSCSYKIWFPITIIDNCLNFSLKCVSDFITNFHLFFHQFSHFFFPLSLLRNYLFPSVMKIPERIRQKKKFPCKVRNS